ncbi:hypothetical protein [Paenibacillus woosongensis]|uniref:Uncharacterized protein n=1 Tax=Paenibacillus woosongensis TaxID=307580 RepID=A0A7X3CNU0_9BACL|nr:hypothetical protein [Paenibacillus woosongensis]MUG46154.1 hypothetical protein [Paenibacillus woosongensis]
MIDLFFCWEGHKRTWPSSPSIPTGNPGILDRYRAGILRYATYEESVKYGRAVTKAFFAITVVEGAARAGAKFSGKTVKELL